MLSRKEFSELSRESAKRLLLYWKLRLEQEPKTNNLTRNSIKNYIKMMEEVIEDVPLN